MKKGKTIFFILLAIGAVVTACFLFIHRNVIKALIKGEELPEIPEGHPQCCPLTKENQ
ncbi:MAG: hypothetical protein IKF90_23375 [Parasporobacterium sp.]|nr:hypothetical protein [Parasporobacterium sp.]